MAQRATPQYQLGILVTGRWTQWTTAEGQDYYVETNTGTTQNGIPAGWEDDDSVSTIRTPQQPSLTHITGRIHGRNARTGRIKTINFDTSQPRTFLEDHGVLVSLRLVERSPESGEHLYRRVMSEVLRYFFTKREGFLLFQEEVRGERSSGGTIADMVVFKILARPGGSMYTYDYCMVESKRAGRSWREAEDHLSRHCENTDNTSKQVYALLQIGLLVKFYSANHGVLTALSGRLHLRDHVDEVTAMFTSLKRDPLPVG
nr:hypothetical protein CFP56_11951 [Quercus suber]